MCNNSINTNDLMKECPACGHEFISDESGQECCDNTCAAAYYGWGSSKDDYHYDIEWE